MPLRHQNVYQCWFVDSIQDHQNSQGANRHLAYILPSPEHIQESRVQPTRCCRGKLASALQLQIDKVHIQFLSMRIVLVLRGPRCKRFNKWFTSHTYTGNRKGGTFVNQTQPKRSMAMPTQWPNRNDSCMASKYCTKACITGRSSIVDPRGCSSVGTQPRSQATHM